MTANTLDLRYFPRNGQGILAVGEGDYTTSQYQPGHETSRSLPSFVTDIKRDMLKAVREHGGFMSRAEIAKAISKKKTPHLVNNLEQLVEMGYLARSNSYWRNGCIMFYYTAL